MLGTKQAIEMIGMHLEGKSFNKIGEALGITKGRVSQILSKPENQELKQEMVNRMAYGTVENVIETIASLHEVIAAHVPCAECDFAMNADDVNLVKVNDEPYRVMCGHCAVLAQYPEESHG